MKTLAYILVVCLVILASCGGCGSSKMYDMEQISADSVMVGEPGEGGNSIEKEVFNSGDRRDNEGIPAGNPPTINVDIDNTPESSISQTIQSDNGTLVYKVDSVLTIGVVSRVEARIIKKVGQATNEQLVSMTTHTTTGIIKTEVIKVGNIMDMDLVSLETDIFTINKISSGDQPIDESTITEWLWGVTALKTGDYTLILKAKIRENNVTREKIVFDKQINVKNKPKKFYNIDLIIPKKLLRYEENIIRFNMIQRVSDTYNIEWGGNGRVELEFDENIKIIEKGDYNISDDKGIFQYEWIVEPDGNKDSLHYTIKIIGDYEELVIYDRYVVVDKNIKETTNRFMDEAAKRWYWVFTTLLIPLYHILKKKYFPEKKIFTRRRRKTPPKP